MFYMKSEKGEMLLFLLPLAVLATVAWGETREETERYALAKVVGTPSEHEAPQDILVNQPDYVVYVPRQVRDRKRQNGAMRGDTYNDHFQVLVNPKDGSYHAFWTQASNEGDIDQHIAYSRSTDGGKNWTEAEVLAGSPNKRHPMALASWQQPMVSRSGRLYCLWAQQISNERLCGNLFGAYSDDNGVTWSAPQVVKVPRTDADNPDPSVPPGWIQWQRPLRQGPEGRYFVATSHHGKAPYDDKPKCKIEFWQYENIDDDPAVKDIRITQFATGRAALDPSRIEGGPYFKPKHEAEALEEASVVKLPDGRLFAVMRSSVGHPVWSQSRDGGKTWSGPKPLRDRDGGTCYLHPRSPCPMYDWKGEEAASGQYFVLVHNTFDFGLDYAYQNRGPLYLLAGRFNPDAKDQPVEFAPPKLFAPRNGNSFYSSYTVHDGKGILWFNDYKFYLCGRNVGPEWFEDEPASARSRELDCHDEGGLRVCRSMEIVDRLYPFRDFTLEGWFSLPDRKTEEWPILVQQGEGSTAGTGGWFVSLLGADKPGECRFHLCVASKVDADFPVRLTAEETASLTAGRRHFALTCDADDGTGRSVWTCFLDGVPKGSLAHPKMPVSTALGKRQFFLGGRDAPTRNLMNAAFEGWRLTGRVLTPEAFRPSPADATVDFSAETGCRIRALNGGNLGPQFANADLYGAGTNDFAALRVPLTRLHDAPKGNAGCRLVDIQHIFGNANADPDNPDNYYFAETDDYIRRIRDCGGDIMFRLGTSIEHSNGSYAANPPADFERWAKVCLGIVRHYNAGWANGFRWNIRYWEIWNEPDIGKEMWTGTMDDYVRLYALTARQIKDAFPDVKVGGPSFARFHPEGERNFSEAKAHAFLAHCRDHGVPLDFFSWHRYGFTLAPMLEEPAKMRKVLDSYGFAETELILDEWHYWPPAGFQKSVMEDPRHGLASMNAAAYAVAALVGWQDTPLTMSCHYTLGPLLAGWGAWDESNGRNRLFYAYRAFARMLDYPQRAQVQSCDAGLQVLAGRNAEGRRAVLVANFKTGLPRIRLELKGVGRTEFRLVRTDEDAAETAETVSSDADGVLVLPGAPEDASSVILLEEICQK